MTTAITVSTRKYLYNKTVASFLVVTFFIFINNNYFSTIPAVASLLHRTQLFLFVVFFVAITLVKKIDRHITATLLFALLYFICYILSTLVNNGSFFLLIGEIVDGLLFIIVMYYFIIKKKTAIFLRSMAIVAFLSIATNVLLIVLNPYGIYLNRTVNLRYISLLGHKNQNVPTLLWLSSFIVLYKMYCGKSEKSYIFWLYIINLFVAIIAKSSTSTVAIVASGMFYYIYPYRTKLKIITFVTTASIVLSFVLTIATPLLTQIPIVSRFITEVFKKDISFGRTGIWYAVYSFFKSAKNYIFGTGYLNSNDINRLITNVHAHNAWLNYLFNGGITMLASMIIVSVKSSLCIDNLPEVFSHYKRFFGALFLFYLIWFLQDTINGNFQIYAFFILQFLVFNINQICSRSSLLT